MAELKNLLNDKNKLLTDLYEYVKSVVFYGEDNEVEGMLAYNDKKQGYIDALTELENEIRAYPKADDIYKDVENIIEKNKSLIKSIIALDKEKIRAMEYLRDRFKKDMKGTKIQKQYTVSYNNYNMDIRGSVFDIKQ